MLRSKIAQTTFAVEKIQCYSLAREGFVWMKGKPFTYASIDRSIRITIKALLNIYLTL